MKKIRFELRARAEGIALVQKLAKSGAGVSKLESDRSHMGGTGCLVFYTDGEVSESDLTQGINAWDISELPEGVKLLQSVRTAPAPAPAPAPAKKKKASAPAPEEPAAPEAED